MHPMKPKSLGHSLTGLIIIIIGFGFLLDSLNIWDFSSLIQVWWPLILIAIGLASLVSNRRRPVGSLIILLAGILSLTKTTGLIQFNIWQVFWPLIVIFIGFSLLFRRGYAPYEDSGNVIDSFAAFSGQTSRQTSQDFRGGRLTAMAGGIDLDLRKANIEDTATIEVFVALGGAEIKVPKGWRVITYGVPIFGAWEDRTSKPASDKAPTLVLRGSCLFGGIEIHN